MKQSGFSLIELLNMYDDKWIMTDTKRLVNVP